MESAKVNNDSHNDSAICLINVYYRVVLHLWELYLCLFLVLIALLQIADMYIDCKSICYCNMLNCIPNPYNYISLIDIIYIVYAWNRWSWKDRWFSCNKLTKFIIILINRKFVWNVAIIYCWMWYINIFKNIIINDNNDIKIYKIFRYFLSVYYKLFFIIIFIFS